MSDKTNPTPNELDAIPTMIEVARPKPVIIKTEKGKPSQARSSRATNAYGTIPNMMKIKSPMANQPILVTLVPADETKGKAASESCQPLHNHTHKQILQEKERENNNINMVGQSSNCFCGICFDFKIAPDMFRSGVCNHPFCTDCISMHVAAQIQKNTVKVTCPNPNCAVELKPEYLHPILPKEVVVQWESARYESSIDFLKKIYCPFEDCSVLLVNDSDGRNGVTSCECPYCQRLFCPQCKAPWHAEMNCQEFQEMKRINGEKDLDRKFMELAIREMWQRCPRCSIYVQRHSGCEHITCRCGCNFCYMCGQNWEFGHLCNTLPST